MDIEHYRTYCLAKPGVTESFPFDEKTLVFKVGNKMFALSDVETFPFINLKCDPEYAIELREQNNEITPGYHMNKKLWNSVETGGTISIQLFEKLIDHSYDLIVASLPKKIRETII
jgi:predicted DNA-binding protein (MmcQ/YjbR family)